MALEPAILPVKLVIILIILKERALRHQHLIVELVLFIVHQDLNRKANMLLKGK